VAAKFATISVSYRNVNDYHVFTSEDVYGLYVASRDGEKAFNSLAPALTLLIHRNEGLNCYVEHASSYRRFVDAQKMELAVKGRDGDPLVLGDTQFIVRPAA